MLRYTNVRHRLTLWYVGVFGLVLLLFIFGATLLEYWQLTRQLYHAEIQDIETAEGLLAFAPDGRLVLHEEYHNHPQSILLLDRYMEVLTPEGRVLLRNDKLQGQDLGGPPFPAKDSQAITSAEYVWPMERACCSSAISTPSEASHC